MKTLRTTLAMVMITLGSLVANAQGPMSFYVMRDNARFLTDRMVHVLNLSSALIDEIYCINYDYIYGVNDYLDQVALGYRYDDYLTVLRARDAAIRLLLTEAEWRLYMSYDYFYRPISFVGSRWSFGVYAHDRWGGRLFYREPIHYVEYRGGYYVGGMAPTRGVLAVRPRPNDMNRGGGNNYRSNDMNRGGGNNYRSNDMNRGGGNGSRPNDMNRGGGNGSRPNDAYRGGNNSSRSDNMNRGTFDGNRSNSVSAASRNSRPATSNVSMSRSSSSRSMSGGARMTGGAARGGRR